MGAAVNGMAAHGGILPFSATFLVFSDYMKPAIRLGSIMGLRVIYVFTHDSIAVGEDGPTHEPIGHLAGLRAIPGLTVIRPADANEAAEAWVVAVQRNSPTLLALTRQNLSILDRSRASRGRGGAGRIYSFRGRGRQASGSADRNRLGSRAMRQGTSTIEGARYTALASSACRAGNCLRSRKAATASKCCPASCVNASRSKRVQHSDGNVLREMREPSLASTGLAHRPRRKKS